MLLTETGRSEKQAWEMQGPESSGGWNSPKGRWCTKGTSPDNIIFTSSCILQLKKKTPLFVFTIVTLSNHQKTWDQLFSLTSTEFLEIRNKDTLIGVDQQLIFVVMICNCQSWTGKQIKVCNKSIKWVCRLRICRFSPKDKQPQDI